MARKYQISIRTGDRLTVDQLLDQLYNCSIRSEGGMSNVDNATQVIKTAGRGSKNDEQTQFDVNTLNNLSQNVQQDPTFRYYYKIIFF
jgi:hypothetical protein